MFADVNVYANEANLYVETPSMEHIEVYTISGALIYKGVKQAGMMTIALSTGERTIIVKGGAGWVRKVVVK